MSLERVLKTLESLGLSPVESEVYVYLSKSGPRKAEQLCSGLRITKQQLYPALRGLKDKGIVTSKPEQARVFSVIVFEELLNLFVKISAEKAKAIKEARKGITESWVELTKQDEDG